MMMVFQPKTGHLEHLHEAAQRRPAQDPHVAVDRRGLGPGRVRRSLGQDVAGARGLGRSRAPRCRPSRAAARSRPRSSAGSEGAEAGPSRWCAGARTAACSGASSSTRPATRTPTSPAWRRRVTPSWSAPPRRRTTGPAGSSGSTGPTAPEAGPGSGDADGHSDVLGGVTVTADGSVFVGGGRSAAVTGRGVPGGLPTGACASTRRPARQQWQRLLASEDAGWTEEITAVARFRGGVVVAGTWAGHGQPFGCSISVARLSADGTVRWQSELAPEGLTAPRPNGLAVRESGVAVGGRDSVEAAGAVGLPTPAAAARTVSTPTPAPRTGSTRRCPPRRAR